MDQLKNLAGGSKGTHSAGAAGQQKQDPVDKVFDFGSKKAGHDFAPGTDEKITDAGRGLYEKVTGYVPPPRPAPCRRQCANRVCADRKKVNSKISN
ncbi:hypothetical protein ColTof3_13690 [Colletotrichum tofieldiae]|nr:hypothetical protein ColTof3_13690 [Colletotrichum tofieldiae]